MEEEGEGYVIKQGGEILAQCLQSIVKELGHRAISPKREGLAWSTLVGEELARSTYIKSVEEGMLWVGCKHSTQVQLIQMQRRSLLQSLQRAYPSLQIMQIKATVEPKAFVVKEEQIQEKNEVDVPRDNAFYAMLERLKRQGEADV
ncbi:DUF721 domain-containing protein [Entomospira culicis]|uniref:DUF721 domain-containing protein n=1 Tax=Entomospira culicis TaxID=2719989 RepID=A0A968KUZ7_9SPIO|nr:DUF721 domain-containing protein [Entomospira culicis]NIZ19870.1 DUF721 domain-containing protein [Entomospira culicis]NIZ70084.1 DUF721 domain-containing protein [Entomospira culicis]WDI37188.1 DUF721 domain-containing protein [Entomospira culicis]WDI38817.1 DUF721 domain-containing protein [Entomospira culicis]